MNKVIVVSAVNLVEGGPLAILQECLHYLSKELADTYKIIALVHRKDLFSFPDITFMEFPRSKRSWLSRLYYEYGYFHKIAGQFKPFLWLSLHDMTPRVKAERLAVYCHNASPFYKLSLQEAAMDPKFALFNLFYKYLYAINIQKNTFVIVQQDWLRQELKKIFHLKSVIVAHPQSLAPTEAARDHGDVARKDQCVFFYPSLPRVFKNFEIICKATQMLLEEGIKDFEVVLTLSGQENAYAKHIVNLCRHVEQIKLIGIQEKKKVYDLYRAADCVIFPSKLESWGLPIAEAKAFNKAILLADLGYAHETLGAYDKAKFFDSRDPRQLASAMKGVVQGTIVFDQKRAAGVPEPFARGWKELFDILLT